jgi:hypothetical protein
VGLDLLEAAMSGFVFGLAVGIVIGWLLYGKETSE